MIFYCAAQRAMTTRHLCCGSAKLIHDIRDMHHIYEDATTMIRAVTDDSCPACVQSITGREVTKPVIYETHMPNWQVNRAMVDHAFRISIRKKLHLERREAAELFGDGINSSSCYCLESEPNRQLLAQV